MKSVFFLFVLSSIIFSCKKGRHFIAHERAYIPDSVMKSYMGFPGEGDSLKVARYNAGSFVFDYYPSGECPEDIVYNDSVRHSRSKGDFVDYTWAWADYQEAYLRPICERLYHKIFYSMRDSTQFRKDYWIAITVHYQNLFYTNTLGYPLYILAD